MKIRLHKIALLGMVLCLLSACTESRVDFGEQYKKILYIVNSKGMLFTGEHHYGGDDNYILVSVYCASSEPIKHDMTVTLAVDEHALDSLNKKTALGNPLYVDKVMLPEANYTLSDPVVTIKANHQYGTLRIPLKTDGLNADINYTLPLTIVSDSEGYEVNPELKSIVYEVKMVNGYSGQFTGSSTELPKTIRSAMPYLQALSANTVRMPVHTLESEVQHLNTNFMVLTIAADSATVSISPWANAQVTDLGKSTYDKKKQRFVLNYSFTDKDGKILNIEEKIVNIEAVGDDDDIMN